LSNGEGLIEGKVEQQQIADAGGYETIQEEANERRRERLERVAFQHVGKLSRVWTGYCGGFPMTAPFLKGDLDS